MGSILTTAFEWTEPCEAKGNPWKYNNIGANFSLNNFGYINFINYVKHCMHWFSYLASKKRWNIDGDICETFTRYN